jgi:hypothetical protein
MPNPSSSDQTGPIPDNAASTGAHARETAASMGQAAAARIDEKRSGAASALDSAASAIHNKADSLPGGAALRGAAHATADALSSSADYVRENDVRSMFSGVQQLVKNNPGPVLLSAVVLGFLVARTFSRN